MITSACIRTLALIGGDTALKALERYAGDFRLTVINELVRVWDYFDKETYARQILSKLRSGEYKASRNLNTLDLIKYFTHLVSLDLSDCQQISDLSPLANLTQLSYLNLTGCQQINDLSLLANFTQLDYLSLWNCLQISDLSPLTNLTRLTWLDLDHCQQISDLSPLANLTQLYRLYLIDGRLTNWELLNISQNWHTPIP